jgi:hypothetical protein
MKNELKLMHYGFYRVWEKLMTRNDVCHAHLTAENKYQAAEIIIMKQQQQFFMRCYF